MTAKKPKYTPKEIVAITILLCFTGLFIEASFLNYYNNQPPSGYTPDCIEEVQVIGSSCFTETPPYSDTIQWKRQPSNDHWCQSGDFYESVKKECNSYKLCKEEIQSIEECEDIKKSRYPCLEHEFKTKYTEWKPAYVGEPYGGYIYNLEEYEWQPWGDIWVQTDFPDSNVTVEVYDAKYDEKETYKRICENWGEKYHENNWRYLNLDGRVDNGSIHCFGEFYSIDYSRHREDVSFYIGFEEIDLGYYFPEIDVFSIEDSLKIRYNDYERVWEVTNANSRITITEFEVIELRKMTYSNCIKRGHREEYTENKCHNTTKSVQACKPEIYTAEEVIFKSG